MILFYFQLIYSQLKSYSEGDWYYDYLAEDCAGLIKAIKEGESVEPFLFTERTGWTPPEIDPDYEKKEIARKA